MFDDYHFLERGWSDNRTDFVLGQFPRTVQLVISTRSDPTIHLGRFRALGEMIEIRASEPLVDKQEAASLLATALGFELGMSVPRGPRSRR